jgi:hypothetical protein
MQGGIAVSFQKRPRKSRLFRDVLGTGGAGYHCYETDFTVRTRLHDEQFHVDPEADVHSLV